MKTPFTTLIALLLLLTAFAAPHAEAQRRGQAPFKKGFVVGARAGLNVSSMWVDVEGKVSKFDNRTGFIGGVQIGYEFNKVVSIHSEFLALQLKY